MTVFWVVAVWQKFTDVSQLLSTHHEFIVLMMKAASTSETSVNVYQTTWRNIPEDRYLHTLLS
jgi:hypothetical protein